MKYTEIFKLKEMLEKDNIPHEFIDRKDEWLGREAWQICYPVAKLKDRICSCIQSPISYGHEADLLEIMGLLTDEEYDEYGDVLGCLTAEEVFNRIKQHYDETKGDK